MLGSSGSYKGYSRQTTHLHPPKLPTSHGSWCSLRGRWTWRKLHLAVDAATNTIVAATLTTSNEGDTSQVGPLLDQTVGAIDTVMADGAYDGNPTYQTVAGRDPAAEHGSAGTRRRTDPARWTHPVSC
jgi:hypothetical protein